MKTSVSIVIIIALAFGGEWLYRNFLRPIDPLTPDVLALAEYFGTHGIPGRPYAVRREFNHAEMLAAAAFEIKDFPLPVGIDVYPDSAIAASYLQVILASPNLMHPVANGRLVIYFAMWGEGNDEMSQKVTRVFQAFPGGT